MQQYIEPVLKLRLLAYIAVVYSGSMTYTDWYGYDKNGNIGTNRVDNFKSHNETSLKKYKEADID